jgi:hypothetical protein
MVSENLFGRVSVHPAIQVYGNHLIFDTHPVRAVVAVHTILATFRGMPAAPFSVRLLMRQKWAVR